MRIPRSSSVPPPSAGGTAGDGAAGSGGASGVGVGGGGEGAMTTMGVTLRTAGSARKSFKHSQRRASNLQAVRVACQAKPDLHKG
eukprot:4018506-Prymnesium_polylepis.2